MRTALLMCLVAFLFFAGVCRAANDAAMAAHAKCMKEEKPVGGASVQEICDAALTAGAFWEPSSTLAKCESNNMITANLHEPAKKRICELAKSTFYPATTAGRR